MDAVWTIAQLERNTDGGVLVAHWRVSKTSGDFVATSYGTCNFEPSPTSEGYIDYESLSVSDVVSWVTSELDPVAIEALLDADLSNQATPAILVGVPW